MEKKTIVLILSYINFGIGIAAFVFLIKVFNGTKTDPFNVKIEPQDKPSYFTTETFAMIGKQCKCGDDILNDFCTEEQILSGCKNISPNVLSTQNKFLSYVMEASKCTEYRKNFMEKVNVNQVFDINESTIHNMATGLIVLYVATFCVIILFFLGPICAWVITILLIPIVCIALLGSLVITILFIIMCANFFNGATNDYIDFLECSGVNKSKFQAKFSGVEDLKSNFIAFMALNIIYVIFNCINNALSPKKEEK